MNLTDHLAHELVYVDEQIDLAEQRRAWIEVGMLEDLREQIRDTRSVLLRSRPAVAA